MDLPIRNEKPKTRGQANDPSARPIDVAAHLQPAVAEQADTPSEPRFTIGKKAYNTFAIVFFQPSSNSHSGELLWTDFLSAMNAIGLVPGKVYGSVWRFTPREGSVLEKKAPINFHEPHPGVRLRFEQARNYGRRLTRNYGIVGSSFTLA